MFFSGEKSAYCFKIVVGFYSAPSSPKRLEEHLNVCKNKAFQRKKEGKKEENEER